MLKNSKFPVSQKKKKKSRQVSNLAKVYLKEICQDFCNGKIFYFQVKDI